MAMCKLSQDIYYLSSAEVAMAPEKVLGTPAHKDNEMKRFKPITSDFSYKKDNILTLFA